MKVKLLNSLEKHFGKRGNCSLQIISFCQCFKHLSAADASCMKERVTNGCRKDINCQGNAYK